MCHINKITPRQLKQVLTDTSDREHKIDCCFVCISNQQKGMNFALKKSQDEATLHFT